MLSFVLIFALGILTFAENPLELSAKSAVVISADTCEVVYSKNMNECLPMASTTKIMTAILALEYGAVDDMQKVTTDMIAVEGSSIGLVDGDEPYVVPMNYGYTMEDGKLILYLHSAVRGKKLDMIRANPKVFFSLECDLQPFEGTVACKYGLAYASVMGRGIATIVEDVEEKKKGLSVLMKTQTGKDFTFEDRLTTIVSVIRIDVLEYTAKRRPMPQ